MIYQKLVTAGTSTYQYIITQLGQFRAPAGAGGFNPVSNIRNELTHFCSFVFSCQQYGKLNLSYCLLGQKKNDIKLNVIIALHGKLPPRRL